MKIIIAIDKSPWCAFNLYCYIIKKNNLVKSWSTKLLLSMFTTVSKYNIGKHLSYMLMYILWSCGVFQPDRNVIYIYTYYYKQMISAASTLRRTKRLFGRIHIISGHLETRVKISLVNIYYNLYYGSLIHTINTNRCHKW